MNQKPTAPKRRLTMRVAGGLVKHLGLQMYSGAVPAIAELISNAWDAMATTVTITLPLDRAPTEEDQIIVEDDGHGMSFEECNEKYLVIGRDRRREEGDRSRAYQRVRPRRLMSRKGIGKLAGFGIAHRIEVRTVKNRQVTHFALDYDRIVRSGKFVDQYRPELLPDDETRTKEPNGTRITLGNLKLTREITEEHFRSSMARRFTVLGDRNFKVKVNGRLLKREEQLFQFRFPEAKGTWQADDVPGAGTISWWVGFRREPITDEEARGVVVFARSKLAQAPWFFGLSGGVHGQHGMQYLTGEVQADFLDTTEGPDLVATDRGSALWEEPAAAELRKWGEAKLRELLGEWARMRIQEKAKRPVVRQYVELAERLPPNDRRIFQSFVEKITSIPQMDEDKDILDELVRFGYNALTNHHFFEVIRQLNAASPGDRDKIVEILSEWDVMEAVLMAQKVKGRVEIIRKFGQMIESGVPEKPDMQEFLKSHAWLIDPQWEMLVHERRLDTILERQFDGHKTGEDEGRRRTDFFCLAASNQYEVVELKRPGEVVGKEELDQIRDYVFFLREERDKSNYPETRVDRIGGILVYSDMGRGTSELIKSLEQSGIHVRTWMNLLETAERLHREFLDVVKGRAPADDPRIMELDAPDAVQTEV